LATVGQVDVFLHVALEGGERILDAACQALRSPGAKLVDLFVDLPVVQKTNDCEHRDGQEQEADDALVALESHVARQMVLAEATIFGLGSE
jgi:hypothetical protein